MSAAAGSLANGDSEARDFAASQSGALMWVIAIAVTLATFMEVLDTSIAAVSLPYIGGSLSATNDEATWVLTSYLVANAVVLPASGWFLFGSGERGF
jgi:MFS transporter, DHA2 family, multidrug resistance protein